MVQEKKKLDATAEKYKEEMMRIYNKKRTAGTPVRRSETDTPKPEPKDDDIHIAEPEIKHAEEISCNAAESKNNTSNNEPVHEKAPDNEKLMHPPMPEIPYKRGKKASAGMPEEKPEAEHECKCTSEGSKFPPAEELIRLDCGEEENAVPAASMNSQPYAPEPRFESDNDGRDEFYDDVNDSKQERHHMQGNYGFRPGPDEEYEDVAESSSPGRHRHHKKPPASEGQGYLQAEVTDRENGAPISGAAVVVLRRLGDQDTLTAILTTDSKGLSESIPLHIPEADGSPDSSEPYGEYMITVYKEGYYSVNMLPVPVFDTIRSIQPVEMVKI